METVEEVMQGYADSAIQFAMRFYAMKWDYSQDSLKEVDALITEYRGPEVLQEDNLDEDQKQDLWLFCKMVGAYIGEVMLRSMGGHWRVLAEEGQEERVELVIAGGVGTSPMDFVWLALTQPEHTAVGYYKQTQAFLAEDGGKQDTVRH